MGNEKTKYHLVLGLPPLMCECNANGEEWYQTKGFIPGLLSNYKNLTTKFHPVALSLLLVNKMVWA